MGPTRSGPDGGGVDRRAWFVAAVGVLAGAGRGIAVDGPADDDLGPIEARLRELGLKSVGRTETEHFRAIGTAGDRYRAEAVAACEAMGREFVAHFREKGFDRVDLPARKLTVVILGDAEGYARFVGETPDAAVGGQFDLDANRLVTFDFRGDRARLNAAAERVNTFVLTHETSHELCYNTGLLDLRGDVPVAISEGLGTYAETWRPREKGKIGEVNHARLAGLNGPKAAWIPVARLLVEDDLINAEATRDVAYAECWLLVHAHLKSPERLPRFRAYLDAVRGRRDPKSRLDDARTHLGDLARLDATLRAYARRPLGR